MNDLCGRCYENDCAKCAVIRDHLLTHGIAELFSLNVGLSYHPQEWSLRDLVSLPVGVDDGSDEPNFTWVVGLKDGRWAAVRGWHDYTGWDCQSGMRTEWYPTKDAALATLVDWERAAAAKMGVSVLP